MKTLPSSWNHSLQRSLEHWTLRRNRPPRIAIVGIGNTLRSDDAAGILVARRLAESSSGGSLDSLLVLDAGHAPENRTADLRRFAPDIVLLIDAAEMNEEPGAIRWIDMEELDGLSASTHSMPLNILATYLTLELGCDVKLLGIQPRSNDVGETVSREVLQAVDKIVNRLADFVITT